MFFVMVTAPIIALWLCSNIQRVVPFENVQITSSLSQEKKLSELKFEEHITKICKIVNKKCNTHQLFANYMNLDKRKVLLKAFIESQCSYYQLITNLDVSFKNSQQESKQISRKSINSVFRF